MAEYPGTASTYHASGITFADGATGSRFFYRENALGSNLAVVASTGNPVSRTEYDGYGLERPILAGTNSSHRFAGKHGCYKDDSSGLSLLGQRFYSPKIGKFLTQDPIGHSGGLNLYAYCDNSPLTNVDPDGTKSKRSMTIVLGSTKGPGLAGSATYNFFTSVFLPEMQARYSNDYDIDVLWKPNSSLVKNALATSDAFVYYGHSDRNGSLWLNEASKEKGGSGAKASKGKAGGPTDIFCDWRASMETRARLKKGPFDVFGLSSCYAFQNQDVQGIARNNSLMSWGYHVTTYDPKRPFNVPKPSVFILGRQVTRGDRE